MTLDISDMRSAALGLTGTAEVISLVLQLLQMVQTILQMKVH